MKKVLIAAASVLAFSSVAQAEWDVIRAGVDVPYPPFEYRAPDGSLTGFEIELGNAVCQIITNRDCEWVVQDWDGIIPGLLARRYDMIFSSMSINDERRQRVLFSEAYYTTPSSFFVREGSDFDAENTAGKRIGVQRATIQDTYLAEFHRDATIVRYTTADEVMLDLQGGRLDAMFIDFAAGEGLVESVEGVVPSGETINEPRRIFGEGVGAAFRQRDTALAEAVNEALRQVKEDGTYDEIMYRYFDYSIKL